MKSQLGSNKFRLLLVYFIFFMFLYQFLMKPEISYAISIEQEIVQYIEKYYYQPVNLADYQQKSIEDILVQLPDRYSSYLSPEDFQRLIEFVQGQTSGLGMELQHVAGVITVVNVTPNYAAFAAGIRSGDQIVAVNGQSVLGSEADFLLTLSNQIDLDKVNLVIKRADELFEVEMASFTYKWANIFSFFLDRQTLFIKLDTFNSNTNKELQKILANPGNKNAKSYIIDLRHNGGGTLQSALEAAETIAGAVPLMQTIDSAGVRRIVFGSGAGLAKPVVLLVNEQTASAAEIFASAIIDNQRGIVIGTNTYGKGLIQSIFKLSNGGALRLTTAEYLSPAGQAIDLQGVKPDYLMSESAQQLNLGVQLLTDYQLYPLVSGFQENVLLQIDKNIMIIDGQKFFNSSPRISREHTFVPLRMMANLLQAEVEWHETTKMAEFMPRDGTTSLKFQIGNQQVGAGHHNYYLATPPFIEEEVFYVPIRFLAEVVGKRVEWDATEKKVAIYH